MSKLIVSIGVVLCLTIASAQPALTYDALIQQGKTQLQAGNSAGALATGQQAIKLDANRWEAYALAGGALMKLKRYEDAEDQLSLAIQRAPEAKQAGLRDLRKQCVLAETGATPAPSRPAAPAVSNASTPEATTTQAEIVLWKSIEGSTNPADFQSYLDQYPNGAFVVLAKRHLADAKAQQGQARQQLREQQAQVLKNETWNDQATGLLWQNNDDGTLMKWQQATDYCRTLRLAGFSDWRLPTIEELNGIFDGDNRSGPEHGLTGRYMKGDLKRYHADYWSSSLKDPGHAWDLNFNFNGGKGGKSIAAGLSILAPAKCVRSSGSQSALPALATPSQTAAH